GSSSIDDAGLSQSLVMGKPPGAACRELPRASAPAVANTDRRRGLRRRTESRASYSAISAVVRWACRGLSR
ncbi:MAG: hypothetical protein ACRDWN_00990, partial [Acidimicrobiales bacterium]